MAKQLKSGDIKKHLLRSQSSPEDNGGCSGGHDASAVGQDIANIYTALQKISNNLAGLEDIRRTTSSVNVKLTSLISRMGDVEKRVEWLEDADKERQESLEANPIATRVEVDDLCDKLKDMENRNRHNNLQVVGVPEGKESGDMAVFVQKLMTSVLDWEDDAQPPEIDRVHRIPIPRPNPGERPQTILVRFLRSANRELILRTARNKPDLSWEDNRIIPLSLIKGLPSGKALEPDGFTTEFF